MIYWDNNATTAIDPAVLEAMLPYLSEQHYNPSARYMAAKRVRSAIEHARQQVATLIGAHADEIIFTSGGTEATNTALSQMGKSFACATDHPATLSSPYIQASCPVLPSGELDLSAWQSLLSQHTGASLSWVNAEIGVIQDIPRIAELTHQAGVRLHLDAIAGLGKAPLRAHDAPIDYISLTAHKIHGPKGIGALYIRRGAPYHSLLHGAGHEAGRRAGTENVAGIIGFGAAAEAALHAQGQYEQLALLRDSLLQHLRDAGLKLHVQGDTAPRICNVLNIRITGCKAEPLALLLESSGLLCAAGSACSSANPRPSHILTAMGLSDSEAREALRLSLSRYCTEQEVHAGAQLIIAAVKRIQSVQSSQTGPVTVYKP